MRIFIALTEIGATHAPTNVKHRSTRSFIGVHTIIELYKGAAPENVVKDWLKFSGDKAYLNWAINVQQTLKRIEK